MSTFAVFGMTLNVAIAEARNTVQNTKPESVKSPGGAWLPVQMTLEEWSAAVNVEAARIMAGRKSKQLSTLFDTPQYALQFLELTRKQCKSRDLRIRAKCVITDAEGRPIINKKTKAPKVGWVDYTPDMNRQVA